MDLGAYAKIEELEDYLKKFNIEVPRLRGLRLMKEEKKVNIEEHLKGHLLRSAKRMLTADDWRDPCCHTYPTPPNKLKCLILDKDGEVIGINWNNIHGKKRKSLKFYLKKEKKNFIKQYELFNKYCGNENVLYVHARIGGCNWEWYDGEELAKHPRYLEHCDDSFDCTYCDLYFDISENFGGRR